MIQRECGEEGYGQKVGGVAIMEGERREGVNEDYERLRKEAQERLANC